MKRDDRQFALWREQALRRNQRLVQFTKLVINVNSERLKASGRRMNFSGLAAPPDSPIDNVSQLTGAGNGCALARGHDCARDAPGFSLVAKIKQNIGERRFFGGIDHVRGAGRAAAGLGL